MPEKCGRLVGSVSSVQCKVERDKTAETKLGICHAESAND